MCLPRAFGQGTIVIKIQEHLLLHRKLNEPAHENLTGPRSTVRNVSCNSCESDCRSRGREFDPGPVPYFRGD